MVVDRRAEVLQAGIRIFAKEGYSATSVQAVADAVKMPKATLFHYIKSKEDLLSKIFETSLQDMNTLIGKVAVEDLTAIERLRFFVQHYVLWSISNLEKASIYSREWRYLTGGLREVVIEYRAKLDKFMVTLIEAAKTEGSVDPVLDSRRAAYFLWGAIASVPDWYRPDGPESPGAIAASYGVLALNVLRGETPVPGPGAISSAEPHSPAEAG